MQTPDLYVPPRDHPLHPHVHHLFRLRAVAGYGCETILPRTTIDIVFNLGDPLRGIGPSTGNREITLRDGAVSGIRTGMVTIRPTARVELVGINLRAESGAELFRMPLRELADHSFIDGSLLPGTAEVCERLAEAPDFSRQCAILLDWLTRMWRPDPRAEALRWACVQLGKESMGLNRVAEHLSLTPRHLRRLMVERVGVSPSTYVRLRRFATSLDLMHAHRTLTEVAHAAHYFDQAHFCRDFRDLAGMTPQQYRRSFAPAPGHIFTDVPFVQGALAAEA